MSQEVTVQPPIDCLGDTTEVVGVQDIPPPQPRDPGIPAGWMVLALVVFIAIFEGWALYTHHNTISHLLQRLSKSRRWFRWLGLAGLAILGWHLFYGFPW